LQANETFRFQIKTELESDGTSCPAALLRLGVPSQRLTLYPIFVTMNLNRYQWTVPFLKSVPHILDPDRFQVIVHSKIFAIECIHNVFLRIRHGRNFQFHLSPMICSICYNNYIMFTVWNSVLHLEKLRKYYFGENREEWTLEKIIYG